MGRRAFTLVEVMIVVLVISLLLAIAAPQWVKVRENSQRTSCEENRWKIEQAKTLWAQNEGKSGTAIPLPGELVPNYIQLFPRCAAGGSYDVRAVDDECRCTVHAP